MDGSWSQRLNSIKKIMDFQIIEEQMGFVHDNYFGLSNGMEIESVRHLIERWKTISGLSDKARKYVHDRDAKTCFHLNAKLDTQSLLSRLKSKIRHWFLFLVPMEEHSNEKIRLWYNSVFNHQDIDIKYFPYRDNRGYPPLHVPEDIIIIAETVGYNKSFGEPPPQLRQQVNNKIISRTQKSGR
jgi:hypothetical protein